MKSLQYSLLLTIGMLTSVYSQAQLTVDSTGEQIMQEVQRNLYAEKSVYEELSMILTDDLENRDTYSLRKYVRVISEDHIKFLLLFDTPEEYRGVAVLAEKTNTSDPDITVYLPAYGEALKHASLWDGDESLFGTDFTFREISGVFTGTYNYVRRDDRKIENIDYYMVDVFDADSELTSTSPVMQHYIRQDSVYITRTDYFDKYGRFMKQLTMHDLKQTEDKIWNAAMLLMEDRQKEHKTLIKVNKRVISEDYVPEEVFTINWLFENAPPLEIVPNEVDELEMELIDVSNTILDESIVNMQTDHN